VQINLENSMKSLFHRSQGHFGAPVFSMQVQGEGVEGLSGFHYLKGFTLVPGTSLPYWEQLGFNEADPI